MADYNIPKAPVANYADTKDYKAQRVMDFLKKMSAIESSSGQNTNHPTMQTGMHAGTHAVGEYGIMPLTAQDLDRQYGVNELQNVDKFDAQSKLEKDPELQERLVSTLASKLLNKNDTETAAYKWENGQNSQPSPEDVEQSDRIRKFRVLNNAQ